MPNFVAGSAKELAEQSNFALLPDDEYLATVTGYEFLENAPNPFGDPRDQYKFKLKLESFADGAALEDVKGEPIKGDYVLNAFIDHNRIGMIPQPSKARKFFAALLRQPIGDRISIEDFPDELVGKQLFVATATKPGKDGGEFTRVADYRPIKIERKRSRNNEATVQATEADEDSGDNANVALDDDEIKF
jgi:hypothetical protein